MKPIKRIFILKHGCNNPIILENGDKYDSVLEIYDNNKLIYVSYRVNVDPTNGYRGGEVAEGTYWGLKRKRDNGMTVIHLYTDPTMKNDRLPSVKPNPNHNNAYVIQAVQIHTGGLKWDGSHGCITIHPSDFKFFERVIENDREFIVEIKEAKKEEQCG